MLSKLRWEYKTSDCPQYHEYKSYLRKQNLGTTHPFLDPEVRVSPYFARAHYPSLLPFHLDQLVPFSRPSYVERVRDLRDQEWLKAFHEIEQAISERMELLTELAKSYEGLGKKSDLEDEDDDEIGTVAQHLSETEKNFFFIQEKTDFLQKIKDEYISVRNKLAQSLKTKEMYVQCTSPKNASLLSQTIGQKVDPEIVETIHRNNLRAMKSYERILRYWGYERDISIPEDDFKRRIEAMGDFIKDASLRSEWVRKECHALIKEMADLLYQKEEWKRGASPRKIEKEDSERNDREISLR